MRDKPRRKHVIKKTGGRWAALIVAVAAGCAAVVAGSAAARPQASPLSGNLRIVTHVATKASMDALIHNFNIAYPNVKIDITYVPTGPTLTPTVMTMINGGNAPDILFAHPSPSGDVAARPLGEAGKLLDLSKRPFVKRIPKADRGLFFDHGKVYTEPIYKVASGMAVDLTTWKQNGWAVPKTFNQLLTLCDKAKATGGSLLAFSGQVTAEGVLNSMGATFVFSKDPNWLQKKAAGKVSFSSSPLWADLFQHVAQMRDRGCFQQGWQAAGVPTLGQLIAQRKAYASLVPSAALSTYKSLVAGDQFAVVPFPGDTVAETRGMMGYNFGLGVSSSSPNKALALAFIDFAGREGQARLQAKINGSVSLHDVNVGKLPVELQAYAPLIKAGKIVARPDSLFPTATTNTNFNTAAGEILINGKSASDALKLLDDTWGK
jgi:raffinose/stachyose/melibiose transport system substrate-binding protein